MSSQLETAKAFLQQQPLLRVQALQAIGRGSAEVLALEPDGVLLLDSQAGVPLLCADGAETAWKLLDRLPDTDVMVNDLVELDAEIGARFGLEGRTGCHNVVYLGTEPIRLRTEVELRPLPMAEAERFTLHYPRYDLETTCQAIREGRLLGGFVSGGLVVIAGTRTAVGLLMWRSIAAGATPMRSKPCRSTYAGAGKAALRPCGHQERRPGAAMKWGVHPGDGPVSGCTERNKRKRCEKKRAGDHGRGGD